MNLEELLSNTKSKVIYLINEAGEILDYHSKNDDSVATSKEKVVAFSATILNMTSHFFKEFFESNLSRVTMKSDKENIVLVKQEGFILCFFSDRNINLGVLGVSLNKQINK